MPSKPLTNLGAKKMPGAPASGHSINNEPNERMAKPSYSIAPKAESSPRVPVSSLSATTPQRTVTAALKVASLPDISALPPGVSMGSLLGLLFGNLLGPQAGPSRDAAIGAASYMAAEQEAERRLHDVREPSWPTVLGAMPIVPQPTPREPGLNL